VKSLILVSVVLMALLPTAAFARSRVVIVGPGFAPYGWYSPYYGGYPPYGPYATAPNAGEVKLDTKIKDAEVFINGSYAGTVKELKTMVMRPGKYKIEVRAPGRTSFEQQIFVVAGKTMKLHPDLRVQAPPSPTGS
jgi:PEGA domain